MLLLLFLFVVISYVCSDMIFDLCGFANVKAANVKAVSFA